MEVSSLDRRLFRRHNLRIPLRVRIWKSTAPEQTTESLNLSQHGIYFDTDLPLHEGETVEILLKMPEEITDEPATEWRCTGHVVRVDRVHPSADKLGVGVKFDCYEVPARKLSEQGADAWRPRQAAEGSGENREISLRTVRVRRVRCKEERLL